MRKIGKPMRVQWIRSTTVPQFLQRATGKANESRNERNNMVCEAIAPYGITNEVQRTDEEYLTYGIYPEALEVMREPSSSIQNINIRKIMKTDS